MALESPIKKDVDKATRDIEVLNRLYNIYFQGAEEDPPRSERKALDSLIEKIKQSLATATNAQDKFQANALLNRFRTISNKWDNHIRGIENGTIIRPKKRE